MNTTEKKILEMVTRLKEAFLEVEDQSKALKKGIFDLEHQVAGLQPGVLTETYNSGSPYILHRAQFRRL